MSHRAEKLWIRPKRRYWGFCSGLSVNGPVELSKVSSQVASSLWQACKRSGRSILRLFLLNLVYTFSQQSHLQLSERAQIPWQSQAHQGWHRWGQCLSRLLPYQRLDQWRHQLFTGQMNVGACIQQIQVWVLQAIAQETMCKQAEAYQRYASILQGLIASQSDEVDSDARDSSKNGSRQGLPTSGTYPFSNCPSPNNLRSMSDTRKAKFRKILEAQVSAFSSCLNVYVKR